MSELLVATANQGKIREIADYLSDTIPGLTLFSPSDLGITESPEERGSSFLENSIQKALYYSGLRQDMLTIADDSGLEVTSLNGLPGVRSARYSGPGSNDKKNINKLLNDISSKTDRTARFVSVISLALNGSLIESFRGEVHGIIIDDKRGENGFGYDPVFFYPPFEKTFAELHSGEKNRISHRAAALNKLRIYLASNMENIKNG